MGIVCASSSRTIRSIRITTNIFILIKPKWYKNLWSSIYLDFFYIDLEITLSLKWSEIAGVTSKVYNPSRVYGPG